MKKKRHETKNTISNFLPILNSQFLIVYGQLVQQEWVRTYSGGQNNDYLYDMTIDTQSNVYITGYITTLTQNANFCTIKYNSSGVQQWVSTYNGPGTNSTDVAYAIAVDNAGFVYVTGSSEQTGWLTDAYCTIKYDSSGNQIWVSRYKNLPNGQDDPAAIVVDNSGNVYVTGASQSSGGMDFLTIKYGPNGDSLWVKRFAGYDLLDDYANSICLDNQGNVYVSGTCQSSGYHLCTILSRVGSSSPDTSQDRKS